MASVSYECSSCKQSTTFETEGTTVALLDDNVLRPPTYVVNCPNCGAQNSVTVDK